MSLRWTPHLIFSCRPDDTLGMLIDGREQLLEISCASSPISKDEAVRILGRSQAKVRDLVEVYREVLARCPGNYHTAGMIVDVDLQEVVYALSTGGSPFPGLKDVLACLKNHGADVYVASGDSMRSLAYLKELGIDLSRVYPVSSPQAEKRDNSRSEEPIPSSGNGGRRFKRPLCFEGGGPGHLDRAAGHSSHFEAPSGCR